MLGDRWGQRFGGERGLRGHLLPDDRHHRAPPGRGGTAPERAGLTARLGGRPAGHVLLRVALRQDPLERNLHGTLLPATGHRGGFHALLFPAAPGRPGADAGRRQPGHRGARRVQHRVPRPGARRADALDQRRRTGLLRRRGHPHPVRRHHDGHHGPQRVGARAGGLAGARTAGQPDQPGDPRRRGAGGGAEDRRRRAGPSPGRGPLLFRHL